MGCESMRAALTITVAAAAVLAARVAISEPRGQAEIGSERDRFELLAQSETFAPMFRRALTPGPAGSLAMNETAFPVFEYVLLRARGLDTAWDQDSVDLEVSAWTRIETQDLRFERPIDGDVQTASVTYHPGPRRLRLGRQQFTGGAARFARFDGVSLGSELGGGFSTDAYGGMTVLPRWNHRLAYHHLGSEADNLLRHPEQVDQVGRSGYWLGGFNFGYRSERVRASASFHEQREHGDLSHRNFGLDGRVDVTAKLDAAASAILDADTRRLADARAWLDFRPIPAIGTSLEYLHTEPALWLSRQSVLSVFSTDRFDELGGTATARLLREVSLEALGFAALYDEHRPGGRAEGTARFAPDVFTSVRLTYARVLSSDNGYHSLRSSLARRFRPDTVVSLEAYAYFYDRPVLGYRSSTVYAGTLSFEPTTAWNLLWGASVTRSPYAALDAQALLRITYAFERPGRGSP